MASDKRRHCCVRIWCRWAPFSSSIAYGRNSRCPWLTGTGGTISGTGKYLKDMSRDVRVVLSDPEGSGLHNKVRRQSPTYHFSCPNYFRFQIGTKFFRSSTVYCMIRGRRKGRSDGTRLIRLLRACERSFPPMNALKRGADDKTKRDQSPHAQLRARATHHRRRLPDKRRRSSSDVAFPRAKRWALPWFEQRRQPLCVRKAREIDGMEERAEGCHDLVRAISFLFSIQDLDLAAYLMSRTLDVILETDITQSSGRYLFRRPIEDIC